jgi:hypothetical protein
MPRSFRPTPLIVYRAFLLVEIGLGRRITINVPTTDLPLLGLRLTMVSIPSGRERLPPLHRHASRAAGPSPDQPPTASHGLSSTGADPLFRVSPPISRFLAFDRLSRSGVRLVRAYSAFALFASVRRFPLTEGVRPSLHHHDPMPFSQESRSGRRLAQALRAARRKRPYVGPDVGSTVE